MLNSQISD